MNKDLRDLFSLSSLFLKETLGDVGLSRGYRNEIIVQSDGLMQPLPRLIERIDTVPNTQAISADLLHSSVC